MSSMTSGSRSAVTSPTWMPSAMRAPMRSICGPIEQVKTCGRGNFMKLSLKGWRTLNTSPS